MKSNEIHANSCLHNPNAHRPPPQSSPVSPFTTTTMISRMSPDDAGLWTRATLTLASLVYALLLVAVLRGVHLDWRGYTWRYSASEGERMLYMDTFRDAALEFARPITASCLISTSVWNAMFWSASLFDLSFLLWLVGSGAVGGTRLPSKIVIGFSLLSLLSATTFFPAPGGSVLPHISYMGSATLVDPVTLLRTLTLLDIHARIEINKLYLLVLLSALSATTLVSQSSYMCSIVLGCACGIYAHVHGEDASRAFFEALMQLSRCIDHYGLIFMRTLRVARSKCRCPCRRKNHDGDQQEQQQLNQ